MRIINPQNNHGSIRLRFTHCRIRYTLNLTGLFWHITPDRATAIAIAAAIVSDISRQRFDASLNRYRLRADKPPASLLAAYDLWLSRQRITDKTLHGHYHDLRRAIEKGTPLSPTLSAGTYNTRLRTLRKACIAVGYPSPFDNLPYRPIVRSPVSIFTLEELRRILEAAYALKPDRAAIIHTLMLTGCRLGEVLALQWPQILADGLCIDATIARDKVKRVFYRQPWTKGRTIRVLRSPKLLMLLEAQRPARSAYIFPNNNGGFIYPSYVRDLLWTPALSKADVPYRKLHTLRHTMLSMTLAADPSALKAAYLAGHKDTTMINRTYGHLLSVPSLPDFEL